MLNETEYVVYGYNGETSVYEMTPLRPFRPTVVWCLGAGNILGVYCGPENKFVYPEPVDVLSLLSSRPPHMPVAPGPFFYRLSDAEWCHWRKTRIELPTIHYNMPFRLVCDGKLETVAVAGRQLVG